MAPSQRWGLVATVLAPAEDILRFCAHHLRCGAEHIFLYLDDSKAELTAELDHHAQISVVRCDDAHWAQLGDARPKRHQVRQSRNANHAYARADHVDWLIHMDADEFLLADTSVAQALGYLDDTALCARVRPLEALAGDLGLFKRAVPKGPDYNSTMAKLYPAWGGQIKGGFLSHVQGKLFVRTRVPGLRLKIHNAMLHEVQNPGLVLLTAVELAHVHAPNWPAFRASFHYRMSRGSYRAELGPNRPREQGGVTLHEVLSAILAEGGEVGLQDFFREVCSARPELVAALEHYGLLRRTDLHLSNAIAEQFPGYV